MKSLVCVCLLLSCAATIVRADFVFEFEIVRHVTNGNCAGFDFTIECETFVNFFCLRPPSYVGIQNTNNNDCPYAPRNTNRVFRDAPQTRTISSSLPWQSSFQLFIGAFDDDHPATTFDFLDDIFVEDSISVSSGFSTERRVWGISNKVAVDIRYRVMCQANFYRGDCEVFCLARDDNQGHYTCDPADGSIICNEGFENPETNCVDRITACSADPCVRGTCNPIGTTNFTCSCPSGYTGRTCDVEIDECEASPCAFGNCTDLLADYSCTCMAGYTGKDCDLDIDECLAVMCPENGFCVHGINHYECVCNRGYEGPNCTEINPCDSNPCALTGVCQPIDPFQFNCTCDSGYTGSLCDVDIDDCVNANCSANSECVDGVDLFLCLCLAGFEGDNCTMVAVLPAAATVPVAAIGGAVGGLLFLIILLVVVIIIVVMVLASARRRRVKEERNVVTENPYEVRPPTDSQSNTMRSQSVDPLIDNPLYADSTPSTPGPIPIPHNPDAIPDFDTNQSPAYNSTLRDVNNPLYGDSPLRKPTGASPIYSEPVTKDGKMPQKGEENYPYSYAIVDRDRRSTKKAIPPHYEQCELESVPEACGGPQYEPVEFKPVPNGTVQNGTMPAGYDVPKPVSDFQSKSPVYHYARTDSAVKPPKLGEAVAKSKKSDLKKSIYDSQDDDSQAPPIKPTPPPRTKPPVSEKPQLYSYTTSDEARKSIKIKDATNSDGTAPPYNKLEHELGPDVPVYQVRMAKMEGSGYEALQSE